MSFSAGRTEVPHAEPPVIRTGHFREGPTYRVWRPRGTRDWLGMLTLGGRGRITLAGREYACEPGDVHLLEPGAPHDYGMAEGHAGAWDFLWAHFRPTPEWMPLLGWPLLTTGLRRVRCGTGERLDELGSLWTRSHRAGFRLPPRGPLESMHHLHAVLLRIDAWFPSGRRSRMDARILRVLESVAAHPERAWDVAAMAREAALSPSRFAHRFREEVGQPPARFAEGVRLDHARQLLETTSLPVADIGRRAGFEDPFHFSRRFKARFGAAPRNLRRG